MAQSADIGSQNSHVYTVESTGDCSMSLWLPPEILSSIFEHLDDADLLMSSGVNFQWYEVASRELKRRGKALYRWPGIIPTSANFLYVVGDRGIGRVLNECKGIKTLEVCYDRPTKIPSNILDHASTLQLEELRLRNVIFGLDNAKVLLASEIPKVEIHTRKRKHLSRKSRRLLLENKELLNGMVFTGDFPRNSYHGIFPNPFSNNRCERLDHHTVVLEAAGLHDLRFGESLTDLTISEGLNITERELSEISRLKLKKFAVSECDVEEEVWSSSFRKGFDSLRWLRITNCNNLRVGAVRHISKKRDLLSLSLDIRHLTEVDECISALQESTSLEELTLVTVSAAKFTEEMFLEKKWNKLKKLIVRNHGFSEMNETVHNALKKTFEPLNIAFYYYSTRTLARTTLQLDKNFTPITQFSL